MIVKWLRLSTLYSKILSIQYDTYINQPIVVCLTWYGLTLLGASAYIYTCVGMGKKRDQRNLYTIY